MARVEPFDVHVHQHIDVDIGDVGEVTVHAPTRDGALKFTDAHPVWGKRLVTWHIEIHGDTKMSLTIAGNIWPYKKRLDVEGVQRAFVEDGEGKRTYFRVLSNLELPQNKDRVMRLIKLFKNLAMRVYVSPEPSRAGSEVSTLMEELRAVPCLHF